MLFRSNLIDYGVDALDTDHDPIAFDEGRWASGRKSRRQWIADEYERAYGIRRPVDFDIRFNDDLHQTYGTRKPWENPFSQDYPGQTREEWMKFKPKDRYADSSRSALIPETAPDPLDQLDDYIKKTDAEQEAWRDRPSGPKTRVPVDAEPNLPDIHLDGLGGWDTGTEMGETGGAGGTTPQGRQGWKGGG